jgi:hypothetical protein
MSRVDKLKSHLATCKAKKVYLENLRVEAQKNDKITHINNSFNTTVNNINIINVQGKEDLTHITLEYIEDLLWKNQRSMQQNTCLQMVNDVFRKPQNRNWVSTNHKLDAVHVKTEGGYQIKHGVDVIGDVSERIYAETGKNGKIVKLKAGNYAMHYMQFAEKIRNTNEHQRIFQKEKATRHVSRKTMVEIIGIPN